MPPQVRPVAGPADLDAMRAILRAGQAVCPATIYVHPGDLDWWLYYLLRALPWEEIAYLWEDGGKVIGWSLFTPYLAAFDLFVHPAARRREVLDPLLAWSAAHAAALARQQGHAEIRTVWVYADDALWIDCLRAHGFTPDPTYSLYALSRPLAALPPVILPDGFSLLPAVSEADCAARAAVHRAAFGSRMTAEDYQRLRQAPGYRSDLDGVVVAPDGRFAAYALAWLDASNRVGVFEPVGTHPDFQRLGLGRAALAAGLRRLAALGATRATVNVEAENAPALALYDRLGFRPANRILGYQRLITDFHAAR
jgi:mycothiol synthase